MSIMSWTFDFVTAVVRPWLRYLTPWNEFEKPWFRARRSAVSSALAASQLSAGGSAAAQGQGRRR